MLLSEVDLSSKDLPPNAWMCRPCEWYWDDYKDCKKIRTRIHQYFIHGHLLDCQQWKTDYDNCMKFRWTKDLESLQKVIDSEGERIVQRRRATLDNNVWQLRESPPSQMWNIPLPEWLTSRYKGSLLEYYQKTKSPSK